MLRPVIVITLFVLSWVALRSESCAAEPFTPPVIIEPQQQWTFADGTEGWIAENQCVLTAAAGHLKIESTGDDPFFHRTFNITGGSFQLTIRARGTTLGKGTVYWSTDESPRGEDKATRFPLKHDGQWHDYTIAFEAKGQLTNLRIDPGTAPGMVEIDSMKLDRVHPHPLSIEQLLVDRGRVRFNVKNRSDKTIDFTLFSRQSQISPGQSIKTEFVAPALKPIEPVVIEIQSPGLPDIRRALFVHHADVQTDWITRSIKGFTLQIARDGSVARVRKQGQLVAILGPLVHHQHKIPSLRLVDEGKLLRFEGDSTRLEVGTAGGELQITIESSKPCEGPVVRVFGSLEQGLLAGVEYLGKGERSSSKLDVETSEHRRYSPDPMKMTMPLAAVVTDKASVALTWNDTALQSVYAVPNVFDLTDDHLMTLRGKTIAATLRFGNDRLEDSILWAVKRRGLPPLPKAPRTAEQQWKLCLRAINGPLSGQNGWGHCAGKRWGRQPYADMASTIWRLTGTAPELPHLVPGGAHVSNDAIYFVTGRTKAWREHKSRQVAAIISRQRPDGSFRYAGKFRRGHHEDTASGYCAKPAADLLEIAYVTGDKGALAAGLKTLQYMKRFRTPRGAQVWEVPLHTPDLLASAYLVWAYVRGYELTGNQDYLVEARRWAISGLPFVYQWGNRPVMNYATTAVLGSTNWVAPNWIGLPVQWVGGVYGYALTMLAPYDTTFDWKKLARGILITGEQMQYPDGSYAGLFPDAFVLADQQRLPARINPCALVSLRLAIDSRVDSLSVASDDKHRVAAPFPVTLKNGKAIIRGTKGQSYQVLIDGTRVVDVLSKGEDIVSLE